MTDGGGGGYGDTTSILIRSCSLFITAHLSEMNFLMSTVRNSVDFSNICAFVL